MDEGGPAVAAPAIPEEAPGALACRDSLRAPPTTSAINLAFSYFPLFLQFLNQLTLGAAGRRPGGPAWFSFIF